MTQASSAPGRGDTPDPEHDHQQPIVRDRRRVRMDGTMTTPAPDPTDSPTPGPFRTSPAGSSAAGAPPVDGSPAGPVVDAPAASPGGTGSAAIDRIDELEATLAERTADLQRSMADFQNYKRRRDREFESAQQQALTTFVTGLLPVLDDVDRAREHEQMSPGFRSVADGLAQLVSRAGVTRFGTPGDRFDPTLHEALMSGYSDEVDGPTATVIVSAGYRVGDRLVRPARVMVMDTPVAGTPVTGTPVTVTDPPAGPSAAGATDGTAVAGALPTGPPDA